MKGKFYDLEMRMNRNNTLMYNFKKEKIINAYFNMIKTETKQLKYKLWKKNIKNLIVKKMLPVHSIVLTCWKECIFYYSVNCAL